MTEMNENEIIKRTKEWWDYKFLDLAKNISSFSKDPSTQVGSVIVNLDKRIISMGYNGLLPDIPDSVEILNDRDLKYSLIIHAEDNAFRFVDKYHLDVSGCIIFTWPFIPCLNCYKLIKKYNISKIVSPINDNPRWTTHFEQIKINCIKDNIELVLKEVNV